MRKSVITSTTKDDIPALQIVLDRTELFPGHMLPEMLATALAGETEAFWLTCHIDGSPVGFCYTVPEKLTDGTWNMLALAVHPDLQGSGLGTALVQAAEQRLRSLGQRILLVDTSSSDAFTLTRKFYARNGYEEEARIRDFWSAGDHKVIFRKAL
jgi:ribosomal protein S18 acetylase RimI-like enzyme